MTDTNLTPRTPKGVKIALAVSVAINLGVAGLVGGLALNDGPAGHGDKLVRDLGFGPFDPVFSPEDRAALRQVVVGRLGDFKSARGQMQVDMGAILTALRAVPYDPAALSAAFDMQAQHLTARLTLGNTVVRDYLLAMSDAARLAFADRLDQALHRAPGADGPGGKAKPPAEPEN